MTSRQFSSEIYAAQNPIVMRGIANDWPVVKAAIQSDEALVDYLKAADNQTPTSCVSAEGAPGQLLFYSDDFSGLNFDRRQKTLSEALDDMLDASGVTYLQSVQTAQILPSFMQDNPSSILTQNIPARIWVGNRLSIQTHFDLSQNIAVVAAGSRRFTLFPPDQTANLYMGPMEFTPAGTPVSLVRLDSVDHTQFPRFREAAEHALTATLKPGDAIFIPYLWWHHVSSLAPLNVLVNYWWNEYDAMGSPMDTLLHAILTLRDLPPPMRDAWSSMFDALVFNGADAASAHIPEIRRGGLGPHSRSLRAELKSRLEQGIRRMP